MKLLIICGPTATGKTSLAISLAKKFNGELISADSRQVYKDFDALTGKDRSQDTRIWLYDVTGADQPFSAADFVRLAKHAIDDIHARGKLPIVVGGTGFYLRALTTPIDSLRTPPNPKLRAKLRTLTLGALQQKLQIVDARRWEAMNQSDRKNPRRLIRAIEVALSSKRTTNIPPRYDALWIGLAAPLGVIANRIARRVAERFDKAVREVGNGLPPILGLPALLSFKRGESSKEETLVAWAQAEYQYAKRQMTWFKKEKQVYWFDVSKECVPHVEAVVEAWYTQSV